MQVKFHNKSGSLTAYPFACGYVERKQAGINTVDLYRDGCWHVTARNDDKGRFLWECFDSLTQARAFHRQQIRALSA